MIYWTILTEKSSDEIAPIIRRIDETVARFQEEHPDREDALAVPWSERPDIYVQQIRASYARLTTPEMARRLDRRRSAVIFEGPADPHACPIRFRF
jgi:hypothetical protein